MVGRARNFIIRLGLRFRLAQEVEKHKDTTVVFCFVKTTRGLYHKTYYGRNLRFL
jgi:hypothetical protein